MWDSRLGRLRLRAKGSAGGHNGHKNIALHLKSEEYTITTDLKWKTMQNDGGSHRSIVYIINLKDYVVTKKEEIYHANLGGTPEISTTSIKADLGGEK